METPCLQGGIGRRRETGSSRTALEHEAGGPITPEQLARCGSARHRARRRRVAEDKPASGMPPAAGVGVTYVRRHDGGGGGIALGGGGGDGGAESPSDSDSGENAAAAAGGGEAAPAAADDDPTEMEEEGGAAEVTSAAAGQEPAERDAEPARQTAMQQLDEKDRELAAVKIKLFQQQALLADPTLRASYERDIAELEAKKAALTAQVKKRDAERAAAVQKAAEQDAAVAAAAEQRRLHREGSAEELQAFEASEQQRAAGARRPRGQRRRRRHDGRDERDGRLRGGLMELVSAG